MYFSRLFLTCTLIEISSLPLICLQLEVVPEGSKLFLDKYPSPSKTPDPININTNNVTKLHNINQLTLETVVSERVIVENDGTVVQATLLNKASTKSTATKGVLSNDNYVLKKIVYFWTDDKKGVAGTTINGKGFPLKNLLIYYNEKYGTFEKALNYRDGLLEMGFSIRVGSIRNKKFDRYAKILKQILKAGSRGVETKLNTAVNWFLGNSVTSPNSTYYAYPASYLDKERNVTYYSATAVVLSFVSQIEKKQFQETFESFENSSGQPLINPGKMFPQDMPVVQAKGVESRIEI